MAEDDHFFSRWSRRKVQARQGIAPQAQPASDPREAVQQTPAPPPPATSAAPLAPSAASDDAPIPAKPPAPTLDDVGRLTRESDFSRFVAPEVSGEVRNAALKKLFSDPHFNVMDGLDIYIDDYSRPDPLPASMLRQMAQSAFVGLAEPPDPQGVAAPAATSLSPIPGQPPLASTTGEGSQAMPCSAGADAAGPKAYDEDPDLRLQPLDDPGSPGTGSGAGEDTPCQR